MHRERVPAIFVAATRQNDGKTVLSLGLVLALQKQFGAVGFIKPVGQKYVVVEGEKVDKDAVLMKEVCGLKERLKDINPVAIEEGFTRRYLEKPDVRPLLQQIKESYIRVSEGKEVTVIEGTGHGGVGAVFDLSNAAVASLLKVPVVLISIGGIGRPIDEIALNVSYFRDFGVRLKGALINKVLPEKKFLVEKYVSCGLARMNIQLLGVIPFVPLLTQPTVGQVFEAVKGKVVVGGERLRTQITSVLVGAMTPRHALDYFRPGSLLITPGDREDIILAALSHYTVSSLSRPVISGIILSGGLQPHKTILDLIVKADIPTIISSEGTYEVASLVHALEVKIRAEDKEKVETARRLVEGNINLKQLLEI
ncbi:MAG: AAA family ATPase [Candidatus Omnitrophica bacterium]|nr:AAA family ATPase [Candidatus Omnitrophota bacterium]MCM8768540.1 AAA family ATPase [Candidatus Omnitrophota bacterium]